MIACKHLIRFVTQGAGTGAKTAFFLSGMYLFYLLAFLIQLGALLRLGTVIHSLYLDGVWPGSAAIVEAFVVEDIGTAAIGVILDACLYLLWLLAIFGIPASIIGLAGGSIIGALLYFIRHHASRKSAVRVGYATGLFIAGVMFLLIWFLATGAGGQGGVTRPQGSDALLIVGLLIFGFPGLIAIPAAGWAGGRTFDEVG